MPSPGGVIRVEPLCQIALERSVPDVTEHFDSDHCWSFWQSLRVIAPSAIKAGPSSSRAAAPIVVDRTRNRFDRPSSHYLIMDEIQLMKVVEVMQEELHVPCLLVRTRRLFCSRHSIVMHKLLESAVRNRIALNIA